MVYYSSDIGSILLQRLPGHRLQGCRRGVGGAKSVRRCVCLRSFWGRRRGILHCKIDRNLGVPH